MLQIFLYIVILASLQDTWSFQRPRIHDEINHGWTTLHNSLKERSSSGMSFPRHNMKRSQMTFLPVYYPNYMLRRKRLPLMPSNIYPHRGMFPINQNDKRNHFRYFTFSYLPGSTNMLNKAKWSNFAYPFKSFNTVLKTTPKANYYMLSPEKLKIDLHNREPYFTKPISSTHSLAPNNCVNTYKLDANYAHILPACIDKMPTLPTPVDRLPLNNTKYISTTLRSEPSTRNSYTQHLFSTTSLLNSMNRSHIYFTIGDAITPRTLGNSEFRQEKRTNSKNYEAYSPTEYYLPKSHTTSMVSEWWTMASNPINLQQTASFSQPLTNAPPSIYSFKDDETQSTTPAFNIFAYTNMKTTQPQWSLGRFQNNTCSNSLWDIIKNCASENIDNTKAFYPTVPLPTSTAMTTVKTLPIGTTIAYGAISTPLTKVPYLDKISTTVFWNVTQETKILSEKLSSTTSTSTKRPPYRRTKIAHISKRLVFKEKIKAKERVVKTTTTAATPLRVTESKTKVKRKYISSTFPSSTQTMSSTRATELGPLTRASHFLKKPKNKFQVKNRRRWNPSYEKTYGKANGGNTTTSTANSTIATVFKLTTSPEPLRSAKSSKLRSNVSRHSRRSNLMQTSTTRIAPDTRLQSTTSVASSTPESAIMRISNMSGGKYSIAKNNSSNFVIAIPKPSNGFVAELPIVTYFKEITESRQM